MEVKKMKKSNHILTDKEMELVGLLMQDVRGKYQGVTPNYSSALFNGRAAIFRKTFAPGQKGFQVTG